MKGRAMTNETAGTIREVVTSLEVEEGWTIGEALEIVSEILEPKFPKREIFGAWLFGAAWGNPTV